MKTLKMFASVRASLYNYFSLERHLVDRSTYKERLATAFAAWQLIAN